MAGQTGDNDQEEEVVGGARGAGRKRKCRSVVTSYKEPTMGSVSALLGIGQQHVIPYGSIYTLFVHHHYRAVLSPCRVCLMHPTIAQHTYAIC